tara:strand:- start:2905 stop:5688 length:2784 start_codon:yes stop_codon:yes gene_type:complete
MSTQLILYPQYYQGFSSTASPSFNQFVVNGINFTGLDSTSLHNTTSQHPTEDAIIQQHPYILGNWYRFTTTGGDYGAVTAPALALGSVQLSYNAASVGHTGIYQKLSNLIPGAIYDIKISIVTPTSAPDLLELEMWDVITRYQSNTFITNTNLITATFTAQTPNDILLINYIGTTASILVSKISVMQSPQNPSLVYSDLDDGQVICDLYQEEDIPLSLSIDDFKNVAEQVKSYSKDFSLPATKRNNQIFNDMYEVTRSIGNSGIIFNPYVKTKCVLKEDGFILFEGYLRLIDVKDKEGEISYNVNLYSEVVALADVLKDKKISDLDFTELEHKYNKTGIRRSWNDGTWQDIGLPLINTITSASFAYDASLASPSNHTSVLKYPFIDWNHQFIVAPAGGTPTAGNPQLPLLETAFRPCIQLKYLINKIFADTNQFNWTSAFFNTTVAGGGTFDFDKLYMDFNWGGGNAPLIFSSSGQSSQTVDQTITTSFSTLLSLVVFYPSELGYSAGVFTAPNDSQTYSISYDCLFEDAGVSTSLLDVEWIHTIASTSVDVPIDQITLQSLPFTYAGSFTRVLMAGDTLKCRAKANTGTLKFVGVLPTNPQFIASSSLDETANDALLETLRGELGQWEFLKGIMTMFNLITMVDENNPDNILIEPYGDVFINNTNGGAGNLTLADRGIQHDWTDKVDVSEMELTPLTDLNRDTVFKFVEDDDDYAFNVYKRATSGRLYGSKVWDASGFTILEGEEEIIAEPFAATVSKPLMSQFASFIVPAVYSMSDDGTSEGFDNSPRIFYDNGVKDTGASYYIPPQNLGTASNETEFLQFSHLTQLPPGAISITRKDFVFESQQLIGLGAAPTDNLFSVYWQPYFNELYSPDTRTMTLKVNLSPADVAEFKFYDTVFIKNRVFRVNKIDYKPNDLATVEFILIP